MASRSSNSKRVAPDSPPGPAQSEGGELELPQSETLTTFNPAYCVGQKLRNRHIDESGIVDSVAVNAAGAWYYMTTVSGMSLGWWHETDIFGAPKTPPPSEKSERG